MAMSAAERALEFVRDGAVVGLGSGRAATAFVRALGQRVADGLRVRAVPTSEATRKLAQELGIPLVGLDAADALDVAVDGADEVDPGNDLIKGYGGALLREKVVASAARRLVILVGSEKLVPVLGSRGRLPVEVLPFAEAFVRARLERLGHPAELRRSGGAPFVTDNGNHVLDCAVSAIGDPAGLDSALRVIPGVLATGLFLGMAEHVVVEHDGRVEVR
jgi:ribose 5-phosphate isomerase A